MRDLIDIVETGLSEAELAGARSKHATYPPHWMAAKERTPVGKYLYHGTPLQSLLNILHVNEISTGGDWRGEGDRVALTRSYRVAYGFGEKTDFSEYPTVLVLDWARLAKNFEIIPYDDVDAEGGQWKNSNSEDGSEQEEAVYGAIRPLSKYLVSVNVEPRLLLNAYNDADLAEWAIHEMQIVQNRSQFQRWLKKLMDYPKLNKAR